MCWRRSRNAVPNRLRVDRGLRKGFIEPLQRKSLARTGSRAGVDLSVAFDDGQFSSGTSDPVAQVADEFLKGFHLGFGREIAVVIADEADADGDVVQVIAGNVSAVDLAGPTAAHLDFAKARGCAVADDEVVGETVFHFPRVAVVGVENLGVALPRGAVVNDDVFPPAPSDGGLVDGFTDRRGEIFVATAADAQEGGGLLRGGDDALVTLAAGFFHRDGGFFDRGG